MTQVPVPAPSTVPFLDSVAARWPTRDRFTGCWRRAWLSVKLFSTKLRFAAHRCRAAPLTVDGSTAAPSIATGTAGAPEAAGFGVLHQSAALRHRRLRIVRRSLLLFGVPSLPFPSLAPSIASTGFHHCRACDRSDTLCAQSAGYDRVLLPFLSFPLYVFVTIRRIEKAQTFDDPDQLAAYGSLYDRYAVHTDFVGILPPLWLLPRTANNALRWHRVLFEVGVCRAPVIGSNGPVA